jgi:putative transposase
VRKSRYSEEQIIKILREAEKGRKVPDLCRDHGIAQDTFYRWRRKYGGMEVADAKRLRQLEEENRRLKKVVADLTLDKEALKDALSRKW